MVTYVNMADLVTNYFMPRQKLSQNYQIKLLIMLMMKHLKPKAILSNKLEEIDDLVEAKLKELSDS